MPTPNPLTTVLTELTAIDSASAAIQSTVGTYPPGTAGLSTVEGYLATINTASASLRALVNAATPPPIPTPVPVTPPPVVTPPVPPVAPISPPSGTSGLSPLRIAGDDFTGYAGLTANLQKVITPNIGGAGGGTLIYTDGVGAKLASIDTTIQYNGHPTLKNSQGPGTPNTAELWAAVPPTKNLWFRTKLRFSPGWTNTGSASTANAYKMLGMAWDTYDGSLRLELANTSQYQLYWGPTQKSSGAALVSVVYGDMKNTTTEWTDGGWYDYIINLDFTQPTGVAKVWRCKDGQTPVLTGTSATSMTNPANPWPNINQVMISMNLNQSLTKSQSINYGQWEAISGIDHPNPYNL